MLLPVEACVWIVIWTVLGSRASVDVATAAAVGGLVAAPLGVATAVIGVWLETAPVAAPLEESPAASCWVALPGPASWPPVALRPEVALSS
jgi:hypothetical protein